jgi:hypothetical protein
MRRPAPRERWLPIHAVAVAAVASLQEFCATVRNCRFLRLRSFRRTGLWLFLPRDAVAFANDQFVAGYTSPLTISVYVPSSRPSWTRNRCRPLVPKNPELQQAIGRTASANNGSATTRRKAQRLIGRARDVIASFDHDPDHCRHAGLEQKIRIGRTDDDVVGRDVLICLRRWPNLRHRAREQSVRKNLDGERSFVTELDLALSFALIMASM